VGGFRHVSGAGTSEFARFVRTNFAKDQEDSIIPLVLTQYSGSNDSGFDLSLDIAFTAQDLSFWIHEVKGTWIGDASLNGSFGNEDRVTVFQTVRRLTP
jgi:hypothetical protein